MVDDDENDVVLALGNEACRLRLVGAPGAFLDQLLPRYSPWRLPASMLVRERVALGVQFVPAQPASSQGRDTQGQPLTVQETPTTLTASRWDFSLQISPNADGTWRAQARCELNVLTFDSMLRIMWSLLLPRLGGMLIHACAVQVEHTAVLLPGPSGAGKSTFAAKMSNADDVLTDELAALMPEAGGAWRVFSTPFWGDFRRGGGCLRSWPLRGIAFLQQSETFALQPIEQAEALARFLGCFLYFNSEANATRRNLALAAQVVAAVPAFVAQTQKETPCATLFEALQAHCEPFDRPDDRRPARELISQLRWMVGKHGKYPYRPRGHSMKPWIEDGETVLVVQRPTRTLEVGQVLAYWTPGPTGHDDVLTCHRLIAKPLSSAAGERFCTKGDNSSGIVTFDNGRQAEVLGVVEDLQADRAPVSLRHRTSDRMRLWLSLGSLPLMKLLGR